MNQDSVLVLRTCDAKLQSYGDFQWPEAGSVEAPDWDPKPECGNGLHGWLWGEGDSSLGDWSGDAKWLVVSVRANEIIDLAGKVKFPRGTVVYCGDRETATAYLYANGGKGYAIVGGTATAGDRGTATAGDSGTLIISYWDGNRRRRLAIGYVGEDGIEPNTPYRLENGKFVKVAQ